MWAKSSKKDFIIDAEICGPCYIMSRLAEYPQARIDMSFYIKCSKLDKKQRQLSLIWRQPCEQFTFTFFLLSSFLTLRSPVSPSFFERRNRIFPRTVFRIPNAGNHTLISTLKSIIGRDFHFKYRRIYHDLILKRHQLTDQIF